MELGSWPTCAYSSNSYFKYYIFVCFVCVLECASVVVVVLTQALIDRAPFCVPISSKYFGGGGGWVSKPPRGRTRDRRAGPFQTLMLGLYYLSRQKQVAIIDQHWTIDIDTMFKSMFSLVRTCDQSVKFWMMFFFFFNKKMLGTCSVYTNLREHRAADA